MPSASKSSRSIDERRYLGRESYRHAVGQIEVNGNFELRPLPQRLHAGVEVLGVDDKARAADDPSIVEQADAFVDLGAQSEVIGGDGQTLHDGITLGGVGLVFASVRYSRAASHNIFAIVDRLERFECPKRLLK